MRDLLLAVLILCCVIRAVTHPWIGVLGWTVLSIMNLHQYTWALASMPVAAAMAIATMVGLLVSRDRPNFQMSGEVAALLLFMLWVCITYGFSFSPEASFEQLKKVMKIDLMILVALVALHSRQHILGLAWALAGSIGFFGFKGGLFTILTGGAYRVWGPSTTYIEGNNELALALIVIIPLVRFLQMTITNRWGKYGLTSVMLLCAAAAIGTHSRGALLAIAAMGLVLWWRSERKLLMGALLLTMAVATVALMPDFWLSRMESIGDYEQDGSAMGRINAWWMAWNVATSNIFGGGFEIYNEAVFLLYAPVPGDVHAAHSIYFQILGEHGFVGLFLFLLIWGLVWRSAGKLRIQGRQQEQTMWLSHLGAMCQVSLAGYAVGGAFLSLAYFDLPYNLLVLVVLGRQWLDGKRWLVETQVETTEPIPAMRPATMNVTR